MDDIFSIDPFEPTAGMGQMVDYDVDANDEELRRVRAEQGVCLLPSGRRSRKIRILRVDEDQNVSLTEEVGDDLLCLAGDTGDDDSFEITAVPYQIPHIVPEASHTIWTEKALSIETDILFPVPLYIHWLGGETPPSHADPPSSALARYTDATGQTRERQVDFKGALLEMQPDVFEGLNFPVHFRVSVVR